MFKHFSMMAFVFVFLWSMVAYSAEKGVNIFQYPRHLPESRIVDQNGKSFRLSDFKGEFVVAVFWSRDCPPCIRELRSLNGFYNQVKNNGVRLLLISPSQNWASTAEQQRFLRRYGAGDVDFYVDSGGQTAANLGIFTSPHTVLINKNGEEFGRIRGTAQWDDRKVIDYIYELKAKYGVPAV